MEARCAMDVLTTLFDSIIRKNGMAQRVIANNTKIVKSGKTMDVKPRNVWVKSARNSVFGLGEFHCTYIDAITLNSEMSATHSKRGISLSLATCDFITTNILAFEVFSNDQSPSSICRMRIPRRNMMGLCKSQ